MCVAQEFAFPTFHKKSLVMGVQRIAQDSENKTCLKSYLGSPVHSQNPGYLRAAAKSDSAIPRSAGFWLFTGRCLFGDSAWRGILDIDGPLLKSQGDQFEQGAEYTTFAQYCFRTPKTPKT